MRSRAHAAAIAVTIAAAFVAVLGGCAIRYDKAGMTRVGIGLWNFGDPPGVDWNLDWPRAEVPDLPATAPSELPPRRAPRDLDAPGPGSEATRSAAAIDDNRERAASCRASVPSGASLASRADARGEWSARR